jgi:hypothetical protein
MAAIPVTFQGILFYSDTGIGGGPMPGGPIASHPIAPGGPPLGIWGGAPPPYVDIGPPGPQPPGGRPPGIWGGPPLYPDQGLPGPQPPGGAHPSHPIAPGGRPPGIWGGPPLYPDQGLPPVGGKPPYPAHPMPPYPDQGLPGGTPIPPGGITLPEPPPEYASQVVVCVHRPGQPWEVATFPVAPAHPIPPVPQPVG